MILINKINYFDLEDSLQEQIAREFVDDFDRGYDTNQFQDLYVELYEYDPLNSEDLSILEDFLDQKISTEGEPEEEHLLFYENNLNLLIKQPFFVLTGFCREGRHRLATAIKHNHKIRGIII